MNADELNKEIEKVSKQISRFEKKLNKANKMKVRWYEDKIDKNEFKQAYLQDTIGQKLVELKAQREKLVEELRKIND